MGAGVSLGFRYDIGYGFGSLDWGFGVDCLFGVEFDLVAVDCTVRIRCVCASLRVGVGFDVGFGFDIAFGFGVEYEFGVDLDAVACFYC